MLKVKTLSRFPFIQLKEALLLLKLNALVVLHLFLAEVVFFLHRVKLSLHQFPMVLLRGLVLAVVPALEVSLRSVHRLVLSGLSIVVSHVFLHYLVIYVFHDALFAFNLLYEILLPLLKNLEFSLILIFNFLFFNEVNLRQQVVSEPFVVDEDFVLDRRVRLEKDF